MDGNGGRFFHLRRNPVNLNTSRRRRPKRIPGDNLMLLIAALTGAGCPFVEVRCRRCRGHLQFLALLTLGRLQSLLHRQSRRPLGPFGSLRGSAALGPKVAVLSPEVSILGPEVPVGSAEVAVRFCFRLDLGLVLSLAWLGRRIPGWGLLL